MSSFAVISDIHGDLSALEAVWRKITDLGLTTKTVLNAGDTVAYGQRSAACIEFVRASPQIVSVAGNYDYNVADFPTKQARFERKWKELRPDKYESIRAASHQISESQRSWLRDLPRLEEITLSEKLVALCHYSPVGKKVALGSWTHDEDLQNIAQQCSYDMVVVGHTHTPFVRSAGGTLFVNPGSIGRAWAHPTFAVIAIQAGHVSAEVLEI